MLDGSIVNPPRLPVELADLAALVGNRAQLAYVEPVDHAENPLAPGRDRLNVLDRCRGWERLAHALRL